MRRGIIDTLFSLIFLAGFPCVHTARALPQQIDDLNNGAVLTSSAESAQFDSLGQCPGLGSKDIIQA